MFKLEHHQILARIGNYLSIIDLIDLENGNYKLLMKTYYISAQKSQSQRHLCSYTEVEPKLTLYSITLKDRLPSHSTILQVILLLSHTLVQVIFYIFKKVDHLSYES